MKRALISMVGLVVVMATVGCGKNNPAGPNDLSASSKAAQEQTNVGVPLADRLVGTWKMKDSGNSILFMAEGKVEVTVVSGGYSVSVSGTYRILGDKITLEPSAIERDKDTSLFLTYTCAIEGDTMTLMTPDGKATAWKKA